MFYVLKRRFRTRFNRIFRYVDAEKLETTLRELGVEKGATLCVHSALSSLGYIDGGPRTVISALMRAVGESGTIIMPTFSMAGTMKAWFESGERFDVRSTPSKMGAITELFRTSPGVIRSIHPTHSVAVWGRRAEAIVAGHQQSPTPFGLQSPYARLAEMEDSFMLLLGTRLLALPHHLQERVEFPNLFLPDEREVVCIGWKGEEIRLHSKVMRPKVPYFVAIPAEDGPEPDWCILHDFCLPFPRWREREIRAAGFLAKGYQALWRRRADLEADGVFRSTRLGTAELGLLNIRKFLERVEPEFREIIDRYRPYYDCAKIEALGLDLV